MQSLFSDTIKIENRASVSAKDLAEKEPDCVNITATLCEWCLSRHKDSGNCDQMIAGVQTSNLLIFFGCTHKKSEIPP